MRDAMVGSVVGGLIICALSYAAVAQSASERYPDTRTSLLVWRDLVPQAPHGPLWRAAYHEAARSGP